MKRFITWSALVILAVTAGMLRVADEVVSEAQLTPTATPPTKPASAEKRLKWVSLGGPHERVAFALAFAPTSRTLYAGTWGHSVYNSWDGGQTWYPSGSDRARYVRALAVLPSSGQDIYAGTYTQGLLWSADGGWTWKQLGSYSDFTAPPDAEHPNRNHFHIESLLVFSDQETERILAGTHNGVWASGALSDTWTQLDSGFADTDEAYNVQALAHDPVGRLYAGTEGGLYCSQDGGQTWQPMGPPDGYPDEAHRILSLVVVTDSANYTGTLLIGTQGAGVYALDVESQSWLTRTNGFPDDKRAWRIQALLSTPDGVAYAGTVDFGVFESRDGGQTWQQRADGLPSNSRSILSLAQDPADATLYAGTYGDGVYRLDAGNEQWEPAKGESEEDRLPVDFPVQKIVFAGPDGGRLLAGLQVGGMYSNTIQQEPVSPWERLPEALPVGPARDVAGLAVSGPDRSTVIVAAGTGIFRSTDAGETWDHLGSAHNLPDGDVRGQALVQGRKNSDVLYAALENEVGIYRSVDAGESWQPAPGDLDPALRNQVCCLAIGADDDTVYLGLKLSQVYTRQVHVTHDAGATWQPLSRISSQELQGLQELEGLNWSQRTAWDVFLHGGQRRMLYARTTDGIYVSYDEGQSWQLRMRGPFSALWADPHRPWVVYVASPDVTLGREFVPQQIELTPDLRISYDGGETWTWAGPGPSLPTGEPSASITTLALDPNDKNLLYAGTEGAGVFRADLSSVMPLRPYTPGAIALLLSSILSLGVVAYVIQTGLSLGRPYGLPPQTWPKLAYLRARHANQVGLVSNLYTPLTPLERLVLSLTLTHSFRPEAIWQQLVTAGISTTFAQAKLALNSLLTYRLLRHSDEKYQVNSALLGQITRKRFWDTPVERDKLIEEVHGEVRDNHLVNTRRFFERARFDTFPFNHGFKSTSDQPEYALLGADRGIYIHVQTTTAVDANHIEMIGDIAHRAYGEQLAGGITFLVVDEPPQVEAYQQVVRLWQEKGLRLVLLSYSRLRHATNATTSCQILARDLRRALGNEDLFQLDEPILNLLDFFGREAILQKLVVTCQTGQAIGLGGMSKIGKTSLARQVTDRLPDAVIAWIDLDGSPYSRLYAVVRRAWLAQARIKFPAWYPPDPEFPPEQPIQAQVQDDLAAICQSLPDQAHLVAVLDGLADPEVRTEEVDTLAQAIASTEGASLLGIFDAWPRSTALFQVFPLRPFKLATTARMIETLAVQMELGFEPAAVEQLHLASGGHPLILRQLASLAIVQRSSSDGPISAMDVEQAVSQYVSQPNPTLSHLWDSLTEEEQQVLRSATDAKPPPPSDLLAQLTNWGWLDKVDGRWQLFSQALDRWLNAHRPSRQSRQ